MAVVVFGGGWGAGLVVAGVYTDSSHECDDCHSPDLKLTQRTFLSSCSIITLCDNSCFYVNVSDFTTRGHPCTLML